MSVLDAIGKLLTISLVTGLMTIRFEPLCRLTYRRPFDGSYEIPVGLIERMFEFPFAAVPSGILISQTIELEEVLIA